MRRSNRQDRTPFFYFVLDTLAIVLAYYLTILIRFHSSWGEGLFTFLNRLLGVRRTAEVGEVLEAFYLINAPRILAILSATICFFYAMNNLYAGWRLIRRRPIGWGIFLSNMTALILFYIYFYLQRNVWHPRSFFASFMLLNTLCCTFMRGWAERLRGLWQGRHSNSMRRALLVGGGEEAGYIEALFDLTHPFGFRLAEHVATNGGDSIDELISRIEGIVQKEEIDLLVVAEKEITIQNIMRLLELGEKLNMPVKILSDKLDVIRNEARMPVDMVRGLPLVHFEAPSRAGRWLPARESASRIATLFAFVLLLPLLLLLGLLVKLTSSGGALFVQERIGVNRRPFEMIKFRTMRERAEEEQAQLEEFNESGDCLFKIREDPRVTSVGRFLRRFSLDELPQLVNVLRGDMTIVGPRPLPRRDFENYYEEWHYGRHAGMPGLTCLWQVSGRSQLDFHNMCILDVYYLRNRTWVLDLKIMLRTSWVVLFSKGAY